VRSARAGRPADALQAVERILAAEGADSLATAAAAALGEIARVAERQAEWGTAERALERALRLRPGFADLHFRHACVLQRGGRRADARRAFDAALRIHPGYVAARVERSLLDAREGMIGEALASLRALSREAGVGDARAFQQGIECLALADWDEAEAFLRRALHVTDEELEGRLQQVREHIEAGDAKRAARELRALVPRYAAYPDLHALLGRAEMALGHYDDALVALSRAIELHPEYHAARVMLARTLEALGLPEQAEEQIALVLQHAPDDPDALAHRREAAARSPRVRRAAAGR
jgi:tetratricopeptide (TPR) repeat protein